MSIQIYKAQLRDIDQLQEVCVNAYAKNFGHHWNAGGLDLYLNQQFGIDQLTQDIESPETDYYLIQKDDLSVGFFKISYKDTAQIEGRPNWLELEKIYVLPDQKRNGIGQITMDLIVNIAREKAKEGLMLYVIDTNQAAIRFYEKNGFLLMGQTRLEIPHFKEELKGAWQMVKIL